MEVQPIQTTTPIGSQAEPALSPLEKLNMVRKREGLEPLTELPAPVKSQAEIKAEQEEVARREAAEKLEAEKQAKIDAELEEKKKLADAKTAEVVIEPELDDEKVLEYLRRTDPSITSLKDVTKRQKTKEEIEQEAQQRENDKLAFGLKNGKFSKAKYEQYAQDIKSPTELVFKAQFQDAVIDDPNITEAEFRAEFEEKYGIGFDENSRKFKQGQKELALLSQSIINSTYSDILSLENDFSAYEKQQSDIQNQNAKIMANQKAYIDDVKNVVSSFSKMKVSYGENEYEVEVSRDKLKLIEDQLSSNDFAHMKIIQGWNKEEISQLVEGWLWNQDRSNLILKTSEAYHKDRIKGSHGIPPKEANERQQVQLTDADEKRRKAAERHGVTSEKPQ